jgi:hypothetical protein
LQEKKRKRKRDISPVTLVTKNYITAGNHKWTEFGGISGTIGGVPESTSYFLMVQKCSNFKKVQACGVVRGATHPHEQSGLCCHDLW